jgi:hypothetical protein
MTVLKTSPSAQQDPPVTRETPRLSQEGRFQAREPLFVVISLQASAGGETKTQWPSINTNQPAYSQAHLTSLTSLHVSMDCHRHYYNERAVSCLESDNKHYRPPGQ